jgi:hypothetical protein
MTPALSDQQREVLEAEQGRPVSVVDERTRRVYYLISAEQFETVKALFTDEPFDPRELYPLTSKTAAEAGWADPAMDAYDHYDDHQPQS